MFDSIFASFLAQTPQAASMETRLSHEKLDVYQNSVAFVATAYELTESATIMVAAMDQLLRAAESVPINIAASNTRPGKTSEIQSLDIASGSLTECASALDVLAIWKILPEDSASAQKKILPANYRMLLALRNSKENRLNEDSATYSSDCFPHENLECYKGALQLVRWTTDHFSRDTLVAPHFNALDRSATSIVLNIAEGNARRTPKDKVRFFQIAVSSALRFAAHLDIVRARGLSPSSGIEEGKRHVSQITAQLLGLKRHWNQIHED